MSLRGVPGCCPPAGQPVGVQLEQMADGRGRPRGTGLPGTEPSSDGVSMSSRRDASEAPPSGGLGGLQEEGVTLSRGSGQRGSQAKTSRQKLQGFPEAGGYWT